VGQAILPAAAFQAAFSGHAEVLDPRKRRLKAGCSQDWLPHGQWDTRYSACRRPLANFQLMVLSNWNRPTHFAQSGRENRKRPVPSKIVHDFRGRLKRFFGVIA
jgi:hypothetical protein